VFGFYLPFFVVINIVKLYNQYNRSEGNYEGNFQSVRVSEARVDSVGITPKVGQAYLDLVNQCKLFRNLVNTSVNEMFQLS